MNFIQIATSAVSIIAPYFAKLIDAGIQKTGENIVDTTANICQSIGNKINSDNDEYAQKTLQRFEEKPSVESRQRALIDILVEKMEDDLEFAEELNQGIENTTKGQDTNQFLINVYGGEVKNIVNIGNSENITFQ
ncbi:MAG: hypothetical protein AAGK10_15170 [Cyanobacteria bacterium J06555_3]